MNRKLLFLAAGILALSGHAVLALGTSGQEFVMQASNTGMFEIESSKLALERSKSEDVKAFAQMMVGDHGQADQKLESVAASQNLEVPAKMDEKHAAMIEKLKAAEGEAFDKAYVEMQIQGHREAVDLFTQYGEGGDNGPLKEFAQETLPTLTSHLETIQKIEG